MNRKRSPGLSPASFDSPGDEGSPDLLSRLAYRGVRFLSRHGMAERFFPRTTGSKDDFGRANHNSDPTAHANFVMLDLGEGRLAPLGSGASSRSLVRLEGIRDDRLPAFWLCSGGHRSCGLLSAETGRGTGHLYPIPTQRTVPNG